MATPLINKKILLGISGGIAAYKMPLLVRLLKKEGAEVRIIITKDATNFVSPKALSVLCGNEVYTNFVKDSDGTWNNHVELGLWADVMLIAPCTANTLAKMANAQADNLLLATYMSCRGKVLFAPAMDLDMFEHPAISRNITFLQAKGDKYIEPEVGELASGLVGKGRMPEVENLLKHIKLALNSKLVFAGKKVLITAGPTHEKIDPVRFIGNYSSGKMGYSIAEAFINYGAEVVLISGPSQLKAPNGVVLINVTSADEMLAACKLHLNYDVAIMSAAVADFKPETISTQKIKKELSENIQINLVRNPDILFEIGKTKNEKQFVVGFALETENELANAQSKLQRKNADLIILNNANAAGGVFGADENKISIVSKNNVEEVNQMSKKDLGYYICDIINKHIENKN